MAHMMMEVRQQPPPVYGVAHHYQADPLPAYYDPAEELYNNPLLFRRASRWPASAASIPSASEYDVYSSSSEEEQPGMDAEMPGFSQEDVINFEKYVQRYFQQQQKDEEDSSSWPGSSATGPDEFYYDQQPQQQPFNDEEAARQLHLLLNQQRRSPAIREIQKKSVVSTTTTTTAAPSTSMPSSTTTAKPEPYHQQGGQKEEAMLRPPSSSPPASTTTVQPEEDDAKVESDIYKTIHRLVAMRKQLEDVRQS